VLAVEPEVLPVDEPAAALDRRDHGADPRARGKLYNSAADMMTDEMQQMARVSDVTAHFRLGRPIAFGDTAEVCTNPIRQETEAPVTGRFG
jgi:ABC-type phosphate transport system ATPase subunit